MTSRKKNINSTSGRSPASTQRKTRKAEAKTPVKPSNRKKGLTVVGVGASAGGLEALQVFFQALPAETGMAFVVVTHMHPEHESQLIELLQRSTSMSTQQVTRKTKIEANHVYVISPSRRILMTDTHLEIQEFEEQQGKRRPIDHFFRSMARSGSYDPIAIVLSGDGTDGSVGIKDVKEVGGLILVQDPEEAQYDSMPRAAIMTGLVDVVLPVQGLAQKLSEYAQHHPHVPHDPGQLSASEVETLNRILAQVHARTGHDFSQYKRSTILRRMERRMQLNGFATLEAYLAFLRNAPDEAQTMFNDILIGVTNFFRDRVSWEALAQSVIPQLIQRNREAGGEKIRVWSIGCATGEEAYTLAILLFEEAYRQSVHPHIQIFASDPDERSIARAREGLYPTAIEADISTERLERFFTREGQYYRVKRELREAVLFSNHNVLRDPPISRQDLIVCRNVLIYLQRPGQDRLFDMFHYALNPGGYLFLGKSESVEHLTDQFQVVDKIHRIYQAKARPSERSRVPAMPLTYRHPPRLGPRQLASSSRPASFLDEPDRMEEHHRRALESYGPPSVMVNEKYMILHVSEHAGRYLHLPRGPITGNLLTLVRPELQLELRTALFQAFEGNKATVTRPVTVAVNGDRRRVMVYVRPRKDDTELERISEKQALVFFLEDEAGNIGEEVEEGALSHSQAESDKWIAQMQAEIQRLREQLQITMEEYQSSNEEMKAANEELQAINEEYRSATEELETSKEELQSVNEELQTVNSEMRNKLEEISLAHQELENLMGATDIATLYLDRELRIQRFTAGVKELFNILEVDRGRRISDLSHNLDYTRFVEDAAHVLRTLMPVERDLQREDGRWYLMRMRPYRTQEDRIQGVVVTFIDISELKQTAQQLSQLKENAEHVVQERTRELDEANRQLAQARDLFFTLFNANPIPTALTRAADGVFLHVNGEFLHYFGLPREQVIGRNAHEFNFSLAAQPHQRQEFVERIRHEGRLSNYETHILHPSGEVRNILASVQYIELDGTEALIATFVDITARVRAEQQIRALAAELTSAEQTERHRLAQILHDDLQQRIFAVQMQLSFLREAYERNDVNAFKADFPQLDAWLAEAIQVTRNLSVDLSPPILHGEGLAEALIWLGSHMKDQYGLEVNIRIEDGQSPQIPENVRVLAFNAIRELLFNVVKHSGTLAADILFEQTEQHWKITVRDEGKGFDSQATMANPAEAHGLLILRHRLNLLGCALQIHSEPGKGTQAFIELPKEAPAA